eukprot:c6190_g1_i1.p1 GENE.c6190_g1_i1~~c6190_g1_i1.p1  ORF type:complete len:368 (-),score=81.46 c6190_g1_i1:289-1329(-)
MRALVQLVPPECSHDPSSPFLTDICRQVRESVDPPLQSKFRVAALIVFEDSKSNDQGPWYAIGCNSEAANIALCICAERSALLKIRETGIKNPKILAIHLISDAAYPITPGPLCRELLSDFALPSTPIISAASDPEKECLFFSLSDLYPHPPLYARVDASRLANHCAAFAGSSESWKNGPKMANLLSTLSCSTEPALVTDLVHQVVELAGKPNATSNLHPIQLAAGVLYDDGTVITARQCNAFEFGSTLDAVTMLANDLLKRKEATGKIPAILVHADSGGVLHAPFSTPRAWLQAYGFEHMLVLIHNNAGYLVCMRHCDLLPHFNFTPCCSSTSVKAVFEVSAESS